MLPTMNMAAIAIGLLAILPASFYPFAKRLTWWPQFALGIAFNWGCAGGMGRHRWLAVPPPLAPLCRWDLLDRRVRHDLRPHGPGGRPPDRCQIHCAAFGDRSRPAIGIFYAEPSRLRGLRGMPPASAPSSGSALPRWGPFRLAGSRPANPRPDELPSALPRQPRRRVSPSSCNHRRRPSSMNGRKPRSRHLHRRTWPSRPRRETLSREILAL